MPSIQELWAASAVQAAHVRDNLVAACTLIKKPHAWTQGCYARRADGIACNVFAHSAACFCAIGALCKITGRCVEREVVEELELALLFKAAGADVGSFNDGHSHAEVMSMYHRAIAMAGAAVARPGPFIKAESAWSRRLE